jgi:hypothetical protein
MHYGFGWEHMIWMTIAWLVGNRITYRTNLEHRGARTVTRTRTS